MTLVTPRSRLDLAVDCVAGTRWAELLDQLPRSGFPLETGPWWIGDRPVADTAIIGSVPILDGVIVSWRPSSAPLPGSDPAALLHLHVTSGPAAGQIVPLTQGTHRVGRSAEATVRVADPELSRLHLELAVGPGGVSVSDLSSTNGSRLAGQPLGVRRVPWHLGQRLHLGVTVLELRTHGSPSLATTPDDEGHLLVNRRPRVQVPAEPVLIEFPERPDRQTPARLPLLAIGLPLLLALPLAWLQHSPTYLLFGLMSPVLLLGNTLSERRGGRRSHRLQESTWREQTERSRHALAAALDAEGERRRAGLPDPATLLVTVEQRLERLWERSEGDSDHLLLRVGLAEQPADVRVIGPGSDGSNGHVRIHDVPLTIPLAGVGVLGLAGMAAPTRALARCLVAQLAGWHSPRGLRLVVLTADDVAARDWAWVALLPHARSDSDPAKHSAAGCLEYGDQVRRRVDELEQLVLDRSAAREAGRAAAEARVVVVLDGARRLRAIPGLADVLERGPSVGVHAICLDRSAGELPLECHAVVDLNAAESTETPEKMEPTRATGTAATTGSRVTQPGCPTQHVTVDLVTLAWSEQFARAMAPLRDATPVIGDRGLPDECRLLDLLPDKAIKPAQLAAAWSATPAVTGVPVGVGPAGTWIIDLRVDGPHVLIGGTTGAGKSELLQTLIASLAIANRPDRLTFVLVDYKGGSAFDECAGLPHTVGLVTDLDGHLAERALTSLKAELRHRETILRAAGAKDLDELDAKGSSGPTLARLVVVIDEFRMIAEDLPDFLEGMVRIAAVGRSLGVHLVLATQRPAGIVSADIAANVNLRIALRVRDHADSMDVIEAPDAAELRADQPGRAYARGGSQPLELFQTARVAGSSLVDAVVGCGVQVLDAASLGDPPQWSGRVTRLPSDATQSDLSAIVAATVEAAHGLALPLPRRPWLPPLPDDVTLDQLDRGGRPWLAPYAVVDHPDRQRQVTLGWDLAHDTHIAVVGTSRSGRTTLLRTLAGSLATHLSPDQVHLHAIDGGAGGLSSLARLPHVGVVAGTGQVSLGVRLLDRLVTDVERRREVLIRAGCSTLAEHHDVAGPTERLPHLVLIADGWESISAAWEQVEHGRPIEVLHQLIRDGAAVGLHVALSGDRALLTSRVAASISDKVILRLADPVDLTLAGVPAGAMPGRWPPGRGVRAADHSELQVAMLAPDRGTPALIAALDQIATRAQPSIGAAPIRIAPLPAFVPAAELEPLVGPSGLGWALVGAGGDDGAPVGLSLRGGSALVTGPARSGRSTCLRTMAAWLGERGTEVLTVLAGRSPLADLAGGPGLAGVFDLSQAREVAAQLEDRPDCCVVVDDVERLLDTEVEDVVLQWIKRRPSGVGSLLVGGTSSDLSSMFRGLSVVVRRSGTGVLLRPTSYADGELLGIRVSGTDLGDPTPGRGVLVQDGQQTPVQVAV